MNFVKKYFQNVAKIASLIDINEVNTLAKELAKVKEMVGFFLGVGGSAGNSSHAVNDFRKLCNIEAHLRIMFQSLQLELMMKVGTLHLQIGSKLAT